jgi:hypothetical protein
MFSLGHLYVAAHIEERLDQAAAERLAATTHSTHYRARAAAVAKNVWSLLSGPADRPLQLPSLNQYPYRG